MKINNKSLILKTALMGALLFGSGAVLRAQIPNASFENWTDCQIDDWATPNVCGVFAPVTKTSTAADGSFAARGEVISFFGQTIAPSIQSGNTGEGVPISQRYQAVEGMYMFAPLGGDRFGVNVSFYKGETVLAQGAIAINTAAANYTKFIVPMTYTSADVPDKAIIQFQIFGPVTGSDYHLGSIMHVDALALVSGGTGGDEPELAIRREGTKVVISWPSTATGYVLQSTSTLPSQNWTNVQGVIGNSYEFIPTSMEYFRLFKP